MTPTITYEQFGAILVSALVVTSTFVVVFAFLGVGNQRARADTEDTLQPGPINSTGVIEEPGVYELTTDIDLGGENVTAFEIKASDVVLEGNGHTISNGTAEAIHILAQPSLSNVTVRNVTVTDVETGIATMNLQNGAFENVHLVSNADAGIVFAGDQNTNNLVEDSTFVDNEKGVFLRQGTSSMTIQNSLFDSNHEVAVKASGSSENAILNSDFVGQDGEKTIHLTGRSPDTVIQGNNVTYSDGPEYAVQVGGESARTVIEDNTIAHNALGAVSMGPPDGVVRNNEIYDNGDTAVLVEGSGTTIEGNVVYDNPYGIWFVGSEGSTATDNTVKNNAEWDLYATEGATNNVVTGLVVDDAGTTVSVTGDAVDFGLRGTTAPDPPAPDGYTAIDKYVEATTTSDAGLIDIRIHYTEDDISGVTESDLTVARYDGAWTGIWEAGVDATNDSVYATTSDSGVLGAVAGTDDITDPVAEAGPDQVATIGQTLTFDGGGSVDDVAIASYEWEFGDGTTATGETVTHEYADNGTYTVTLTVTDAAGNTDTDTATVTVYTEDTTDPVADAGPDREVMVGTTVEFDGSNSSDDVGIESYEWDFGDGTTATGVTAAHTYTDNGTYTVTLTVTDYAGNTATDTATVEVLSEDTTPPVADAGEDRTVEVATEVPFDGSGSTDNIGVTSYEWDFGDGATATGETVTHNYSTEGNFTVTLTVADAAGNTDTDTAEIVVAEHVDEEVLEPGDIYTCGVIEQPGTYTLQTDLSASEEGVTTCFEIKASNVTLDGNGHAVYGDLPGAAEGIHVLGTGSTTALENVTIKNVTLTGWESAISAKNVRDSAYLDNTIVSNVDKGIALSGESSVNNLVEGNTFRDNEKGIFLERGANETVIRDNVFDANHESGVKASGAPDVSILYNEFTDHDGEKTIHITGRSPNAVIRGNDVLNSTGPEYAIQVGGESVDSVVENNTVAHNTLGGISVGPPNVTVHNNTVYDNGDVGILIGDGDSVVSENTVYDNRIGLAFDASTGVSVVDNTVRNNFEAELVALDGATNNDVTGLVVDDNGTTVDVGPASVDYELEGSVDAPAPLPGDYTAATEEVRVEFISDAGRLDLTAYYDGTEYTGTAEDDLTLARYDEANSWWVGLDTTTDRSADALSATVVEPGVVAGVNGTSDIVPPTAAATADPGIVGVGENVTVDASGSTDNVGIESYEWAFGDGTNATGETVTHSYDAAGTYTVTLTVTDAAGYTDTATVEVSVDDEPPVAEAGADQVVQPGVEVTVDAVDSTDNYGVASYEWAFGDGTTATGATASHAYADNGTYTVTLTVTDYAGLEDTDTLTVTVDDEAPIPDPGEQVREELVNESLAFDASGSTDNVGIASYEWAFGDGATATGETVTHAYDTADNYTVTLTVTDLAGNSATATVDVEVVDSVSVVEAIDENDDGLIGDLEILTAIEYWRTDTVVPDTGGETIDDLEILDLIETWRTDEGV